MATLCRQSLPRRYRRCVGFNPFRPQQRRQSDYVMVLVALVIVVGLLIWALIPR